MGGRRMSSKKWRPKAATGKWQMSLPGAKPRAAAVYSPRSSSLESRMHFILRGGAGLTPRRYSHYHLCTCAPQGPG
nr:IQ motif and ankyrin repeat domain-containing protein 1 [Equus asinus]